MVRAFALFDALEIKMAQMLTKVVRFVKQKVWQFIGVMKLQGLGGVIMGKNYRDWGSKHAFGGRSFEITSSYAPEIRACYPSSLSQG